uniref:Uncharacterized protein n=1 Tax=Anguilla anguilla TaxID=7936 RepID=A0A0E9W9Y5_ANGAN
MCAHTARELVYEAHLPT